MRGRHAVSLYRHQFLHMLWSTDLKRAFLILTLSEQSAVHSFYRPAENLTEQELLDHLKAVRTKHPNLPQRAGKAYRKIEKTYLEAMHVANGDAALFDAFMRERQASAVSWTRRGQRITLTPQLRPEIDAKRIARAVYDLALELGQEEQEEPPDQAA